MRAPFSFIKASGAVPIVSGVTYNYVDTAGGGQRISVTVNSSTGCTAIKAGGVAFTGFAIYDATHVSGVPGAHAAGIVDVVVTNAAGDSTTGTGLIEYWTPAQLTGVAGYYDAEKGVTGSPVTAWADQSAAAVGLTASAGREPVYTANAFGTLHGLTFDGTKRIMAPTRQGGTAARSYFAVAKWTSTRAVATDYANNAPLTIVGDGTGAAANEFGASADALINTDAYVPANNFTRGAGLNDGVARLVGALADNTIPAAWLYVGAAQQGSAGTLAVHGQGWDSVGAGYQTSNNGDGFIGTIGAAIMLTTVITGPDLTKLNAWARQRFGTP